MSPQTRLERVPGGAIYLKSPQRLGEYPVKLTERLDYWATEAPTRLFLASRIAQGDWRTITYRDFRLAARNVAQALLNRRLSPARPVAILSGNDLEHAILAAGAMYAGIPYVPVSPAYSLISSDFVRLRYILDLIDPQLVFVADGHRFSRAIEACVPKETELVVGESAESGLSAVLFSTLAATSATSEVDAAHERTGTDSIAKILFTSGSTGVPRGVINTHGMLASNQEMLRSAVPSLVEDPPILCDWLPWHHTFGGNHNFGLILYNGGTLYIDGGKPVAGMMGDTVRNLREIAPTVYFNVPRGFELLADALQADPTLSETFLRSSSGHVLCRRRTAAAYPDRLDRLAMNACGHRVPMVTGFGATETGPLSLIADGPANRAGVIGLPVPGLEVKIVPESGKQELRVRGPNVTPGFWKQEKLTREAFDSEGFFATGDAVTFADPQGPESGLVFDGRIAEDFKLSTGTWVSVGPLRSRLVGHCSPFVRDAVIAGHGHGEATALIFVNPDFGDGEERCGSRTAYRGRPADSCRGQYGWQFEPGCSRHHRAPILFRRTRAKSLTKDLSISARIAGQSRPVGRRPVCHSQSAARPPTLMTNAISTEAWVLHNLQKHPGRPSGLQRESLTFDAPGEHEVLVEPLYPDAGRETWAMLCSEPLSISPPPSRRGSCCHRQRWSCARVEARCYRQQREGGRYLYLVRGGLGCPWLCGAGGGLRCAGHRRPACQTHQIAL